MTFSNLQNYFLTMVFFTLELFLAKHCKITAFFITHTHEAKKDILIDKQGFYFLSSQITTEITNVLLNSLHKAPRIKENEEKGKCILFSQWEEQQWHSTETMRMRKQNA